MNLDTTMATPRPFSTLAALALTLTAARIQAADPDTRAREHYDRAVELYGQRDYAAALEQLRRAAELRPHYRLQRALAQVHGAMRDYAAAYTANRLYLEQGGDKVAPERRQEVLDEMAKLERLVALVTVAVDVPGAVVRVDDTPVGQAPLATPVALNVGPHQVVVAHAAHPEQTRTITAAAGTPQRLDFSLAGLPPQAPPAGAAGDTAGPLATAAASSAAGSDPSPAPASAEAEASPLWIGWVATGVLAAGATATGLWALSKNSDLDDDRQRATTEGGVERAELDASASDLRTLSTVTDVLWVAAAAAGGITLWLTLDSREATPAEPAVQAGLGPAGMSLRGTF